MVWNASESLYQHTVGRRAILLGGKYKNDKHYRYFSIHGLHDYRHVHVIYSYDGTLYFLLSIL